jgi:tryptophan halogenase
MEPPASLKRKIELFRVNGAWAEGLDELFRAVSWQSVMEGMGIRPQRYQQLVDRLPLQGEDLLGA